jgi:hypothetical protein
LIPASPWLGSDKPGAPAISARNGAGGVTLKLTPGRATAQYAIWSRYGNEWRFAAVPAARAEWTVPNDPQLGAATAVFVNAVDRLGNESVPVAVYAK